MTPRAHDVDDAMDNRRPGRGAALDALFSASMMRAMLAALVALAATLLYGLGEARVSVSLAMQSTPSGMGEIFFADSNVAYSPKQSVPFRITADGRWHSYEVLLPSSRMERIRIDPGSSVGVVGVRAIEVNDNRRAMRFSGQQLHDALGVTHDLRPQAGMQDGLNFTSQGKDPYFEIRMPEPVGKASLPSRLLKLAGVGMAALVAWLLLERAWTSLALRVGKIDWRPPFVGKICQATSDDEVLRIDGRILLSFSMLLLMAALYIALGLNQSSLGWWENIYPYRPVHQAIDLGTPKRIRSDEWNVQAPWVLNQVQNGSPLHNPNVGGEDSPLIASLPVEGAIDVPQVKFAGFHFLGIERGVSWWWAYKTFALLFSFLWLCLLITRGNLTASLLGAAWIYASSFTQWWFSSNLPEIMAAFAFGVVGAIYAMFSAKRGLVAMGCVLVAYCAANLVLNLYPPFIVPLGYLGVAVLAGYAIQHHGFKRLLHDLPFRSIAIAISVAAIGAYVLAFMSMASGSIDSMLHTAYPGQRVAGSGGVPFARVFYGYFEAFRLEETRFPLLASNASEASGFVMLLPLIFLAIPSRALVRTSSALLVAIASAYALTALWVLVKLPARLEWVLQAAGWSLVTPKRAVLALGVGSILACIVLFARTLEGQEPVRRRDVRRMSIIVVLIGTLAFGWGLHQVNAGFFSWTIVLFGTVACTLVGAGIMMGRASLLIAGLAMYALPTLTVNPLVSGISAVSEKPILEIAARQSSGPGTKWAVIGDPFLAQGLKAHGLAVLAGSQFLPARENLRVLDPGNRYEATWNRYATIGFNSEPGGKAPVFKRKRSDQYSITLDVCSGKLQALGVNHLAYTVPVPPADLGCLMPLPTDPESGVKLFELK